MFRILLVIGLFLFLLVGMPVFAQNPPTCAPSTGCPSGYDCRNGIGSACVETATNPIPATSNCGPSNNYQCPSGQTCSSTSSVQTNGYCYPTPPENKCDKDTDCKEPNQICDTAGPFTAKRCKVGSRAGSAFYGCSQQQIRDGNCSGAAGKVCNDGNGTGVLTAIGCVPTEPSALVKSLLKFSVGIGGGIAFLLMIFGAFQMITSSGSAEALKAGQERFYSAIIGLLFLIFSVILLKIIGVDILGFGTYFGLP